MYAVGENITVKDMARTLSELSGTPWDTEHHSKEEFMALKSKMDHELWLNYLAFVNG
jgi:hypothetical protein